jgi:hypothetical protein
MGKSDFQVDFITINIAGVKDANVILKGLWYTHYKSYKAINVLSPSAYWPAGRFM